jgi:nondiscriminating aspartyl-tRNA synthetase
VVFNPQISQEAYKTVRDLSSESVVCVIGKISERPPGLVNKEIETGSIELLAESAEIIAKAKPLPFDLEAPNLNLELPTLLDYRALTLRHPKIKAIFRVQQTIVEAFRDTLRQEGFTEIFVPTLVPVATEGGAEVFPVDYYGRRAYLAQSPQLYKQIMVSVFERVFTIAHAYRAEPSVTTRHLAEYVSLDAEFGFINSWQDLMDMVEKVVIAILSQVKQKNNKEIVLFDVEIPEIKQKIPRLKLKEAQEIVFQQGGKDHRNEPDLDPQDEKILCEWARKEFGAPFVFVTHFPAKKRPFYTMPDPKEEEYTLSFDLLGVNEEWVTGGQRINDYEMLVSKIKERGNKPSDFSLYLQAFEYGMPPEGGFALGLERITKDLLGLSNVREASLFPRDMERVDIRLKDA